MFVRVKPSGNHRYLQIVESYREGGFVRQRVMATLGRLETITAPGNIDGILKSLSRFAEQVRVLEDHRQGRLAAEDTLATGPDLIFSRLWQELGVPEVLSALLTDRRFSFSLERAAYLSVLHRLCAGGSDRAADKWRRDVLVPQTDKLSLHHLYRTMRYLGQTHQIIEEKLFARRHHLFSSLTLAFYDTTSLSFFGEGGATLGQYGHSKDKRPDLKQVVLGVVLSDDGTPIASHTLPGNTADITTFLPLVKRLQQRFGVQQITWVADRGMISANTIAELEQRGLTYIFGARLRNQKEVKKEVLSRGGRYRQITGNLKVKEVIVKGRRYLICRNAEQAGKDRQTRQAIVAKLEERLKTSRRQLIGNKGYRKYLTTDREAMTINHQAIKDEARFDGVYVLRTNTKLSTEEAALQYKRLWQVEQHFRATKSLVDTRPVFHKWDETVTGHIFISFLALLLRHELLSRIEAKETRLEWADVRQDLLSLQTVTVRDGQRRYQLRGPLKGCTSTVFRAAGVAIPPSARLL